MLASDTDVTNRRPDLVGNATLSTFLADADGRIKAALGQDIESAATTIILDCNGRRRLQLPQIPVTAIASVVVDGITWTFDTHYRWDVNGGLWRIPYAWPQTPQGVTVTYTHGYTIIPPELVGLCARLAIAQIDSSGAGAFAVKAKTIDGISVSYDTALAVADPYAELEALVASGRYQPSVAP